MKKALILSGGAERGAYQNGALKYLINDLNRKYDIYAGISVGALNAAMLGMYSDENEGFNRVAQLWSTVKRSDIVKRWFPFGILHALWEKSAFNSDPLIELVHRDLDLNKLRSSGKETYVGAVCLETGEYRVFSQKDDCFADAILASSSFPCAMKPIKINGQTWVDGGVKSLTPIKAAIDAGADEIDVIICAPKEVNLKPTNKIKSTIPIALRTFVLMMDGLMEDDLKMVEVYNKAILQGCNNTKRLIKINLIQPKKVLTEDILEFDRETIDHMIEQGYIDAKEQFKL